MLRLPVFSCTAVLLAASAALPAHASDAAGMALAKSRNCMACHQVDSKRVGPAYRNVADRYAGTSDALDHLEKSIHKGSANKWGKIPMPAQSHVSQAEARQIAEWILSLKK